MTQKIIFTLCTLFCLTTTYSQYKFYTKNANINFYSVTPLEDIEAKNKTAFCVLDATTGSLQLSMLIKGFEFENEEMQDHFNKHYLESDKFPKSEFKGQIINNASVNYKKPGNYPVQVKGLLTLHGVTKQVQTNGIIKVEGNGLSTTSTFNVAVADYNIRIPALVKNKIAKTVKVTVAAKLDALK